MRNAGAIFASIGTSAMLVAAVTLSLLSASAVFALGGFAGSSDGSSGDALVLDLQDSSGARRGAEAKAVTVVDRRAHPSHGASRAARGANHRRGTARANAASTNTAARAAPQVAPLDNTTASKPSTTREPAAPSPAVKPPPPKLGDGVKQLGDGLSSAVTQTGTKLAQATAPLVGPAVSTAIQQVLNVVAALIKGTTDGLGRLLGARP